MVRLPIGSGPPHHTPKGVPSCTHTMQCILYACVLALALGLASRLALVHSAAAAQQGIQQPFVPSSSDGTPSVYTSGTWFHLEEDIFNTTRRPQEPIMPDEPSTFVGIASYRDGVRCGNTLFELFTKALDPGRVFAGVVDQRAAGDARCLDEYCRMQRQRNPGESACPHREQVRVLPVDWMDSTGPILARHQQQGLIQGEDFCLQVRRAHHASRTRHPRPHPWP
jgi:hypothetical protein